MTPPAVNATLREKLETFGDPRKLRPWHTGEVDYLARLGVTEEDIPELLEITRKWIEPFDWPEDENDFSGFASIHAWRCLAQLGATELLPLLLEMMDPLNELDDDWYLSEFPLAFERLGPTCLKDLEEYLADETHLPFPRSVAANGMAHIALQSPETRKDVIPAICRALERFEENDVFFNAFLISSLLDLNATESAELIERAHAADRVDTDVNGNWNDVRQLLGVKGLGIISEELADQKTLFQKMGELFHKQMETISFLNTLDNHSSYDEYSDAFDPTPFNDGMYESTSEDATPYTPTAPIRSEGKIGRNEPCPCGSGKKYKKCHGR
ncbi:MAG: DUF1186 domain-containing protein [Phycisphaerae bacterium]|nr:DUF1186 domain-containing protein [Phycisphaerae bacterium]